MDIPLPAARVLTRAWERAAYSADASFYSLTPQAVVRPMDTAEVRALFAWSRRSGVPLTFRAAGTSLSGQAVTDGVLVDVSRHWRVLEVLDRGARVRVGPGVIGGFVNAHLARHGRKLGPDPASIGACMIGGIVANNSSGMCCGTEQNAYRTLESLRFVLPSGTEIDSAAPDAETMLSAKEPAIARGLMELKARIEADPALVARIRSKYAIKNTMGYSLNAFLDHATPLSILWHLLVGSEGTLAFIAEAVFRTVPDLPAKSTGLLIFDDVPRACEAIEPLREAGARALELMDRASMRSTEGRPGTPAFFSTLGPTAAALLVEYQEEEVDRLSAREDAHRERASRLPLSLATELTRDPARQAELWAARRGLTATIGGMRPSGTSMIFEDVCFPLRHLAAGVVELHALFVKHAYPDAVVFGHAKDGNVHFLLSQSFHDARSIAQYENFTDDLVELVVARYDGALKAEHGTGRNMAPFVEQEWGAPLYDVMRRIKRLIDPDGILNPGVILNDDRRIHLKNLKALPEVEDEIDRCIECGFCESKCPSRDLTTTPRQRIVLRREQARLKAAGNLDGLSALEADLPYVSYETCATDGMCATACPVEIDTGTFVKRMREQEHGAAARAAAMLAAKNFGVVERGARTALRLPRPARFRDLPGPARPIPGTDSGPADAIYIPSCVTRVLGEHALSATVVAVAARAGIRLRIPEDVTGTCCGMPFSSKGFHQAHDETQALLLKRMRVWSDDGRLPVVIDTSPCAWSLRDARVIDGIVFAHDVVLPRLTIARRMGRVAVHPVCSAVKLGLTPKLVAITRACAEETVVPIATGCCSFAGDRGFTHPELTESATRAEAREIEAAGPCDLYVSSSRTCEIGMARATGRTWVSFWNLLDEASR
ncbi:MAG TPA: FAD-binding and (Fe-S)-binding domain-containing protein, partial [Candidatus Polarisedimenticolaceae bacterium]|nr:FAD-binding and (Fe-S)-binding domain-containing protein [Candidatus Polarisedimenticolaceae bacterium]